MNRVANGHRVSTPRRKTRPGADSRITRRTNSLSTPLASSRAGCRSYQRAHLPSFPFPSNGSLLSHPVSFLLSFHSQPTYLPNVQRSFPVSFLLDSLSFFASISSSSLAYVPLRLFFLFPSPSPFPLSLSLSHTPLVRAQTHGMPKRKAVFTMLRRDPTLDDVI